MPDEFLWCRVSHKWDVDVGYGVVRDGSEWPQWQWVRKVCERCGATGETDYDAQLSRIVSTYSYPRGYTIVGAGHGHGPAEALAELLRRKIGPPPRQSGSRRRRPRSPSRGRAASPQQPGAVAASAAPPTNVVAMKGR